MSKPSTRQELIDYCLRRLGYPVLEVNVDEDQIEDLIDDALQYFQERHYDGAERMLLKHKITEEKIEKHSKLELQLQQLTQRWYNYKYL